MNLRTWGTCLVLLLGFAATPAVASDAKSPFDCPRTAGTASLGAPMPKSGNWYGSEALAVNLPPDGTWSTTAPGALIAVKLFWWSAGFRPGMESNLEVSIRELSGAPMTAVVSRATNAHAESLGGWTMLTGIDFPQPGCWEITGKYLGQVLTFVVETAHPTQGTPRGEQQKIEYLIAAIETLDGAHFVRNGAEHEAKPAADHLRLKLRKAGARVKTAADFIKYCATGSSVSGKPYTIRFADGRVETSADYLRRKLVEYQASPAQ